MKKSRISWAKQKRLIEHFVAGTTALAKNAACGGLFGDCDRVDRGRTAADHPLARGTDAIHGTADATVDVFAVFGPDVDCADISNGMAQPIRCNYEVNNTNFTGLGVNPENGQAGAPAIPQNQNT